ncbi:retroviral-like aspartic protease family protein [Sphingobium bisphenolivorans]|uniref:retroviral-like aspartic protease family protein n=1 Tax=Sphingobium bisphenolivorans TaxID=1335760 RepID=UPI0003A3D5A0|nr:retroviral-like aspartic protease family protein [Sphingobium bisphenolivorans]
MGRLSTTLVTAVAMMSSAAMARPDQGRSLGPAQPPAVVRTTSTPDNRLTIAVHIDGRGPWNFVVDTGSQRTVISRDLAERLGLPPRRQVVVVSMTGRSATQTVAVPRLDFGASTVDGIEAPVLEGQHLGAAGLLGLDGLHAKRLLLNFRTGRMEIANSRKAWRDPNAIIVEARRRKGQLILLDSDVNGMTVNIILDTGTSLSVGNMALMNRLVRKKRAPTLNQVSMTSVTGETLTGQWGLIDRVRMGPVTLTDTPVMFADAQPFRELKLGDKPALLLGISALRTFDRVAIDFGRGKVDFILPDTGLLVRPRLAAAAG